jgi:hypothetical protein
MRTNKGSPLFLPNDVLDCKKKSVSLVWAIREAESGDWEILTQSRRF